MGFAALNPSYGSPRIRLRPKAGFGGQESGASEFNYRVGFGCWRRRSAAGW